MRKIMLAPTLVFAACGHSIMRGTVAMKLDDQTAHVCVGAGEVKEGDHVRLFANACPVKGQLCKKEYRGEGVITKVLNEHYSEVRFPLGTKFEEGTFIEKRWN